MEETVPLKPEKKDVLASVEHMLESMETLPQHAMMQPVTHYDYYSLLLLLSATLRCDDCN